MTHRYGNILNINDCNNYPKYHNSLYINNIILLLRMIRILLYNIERREYSYMVYSGYAFYNISLATLQNVVFSLISLRLHYNKLTINYLTR